MTENNFRVTEVFYSLQGESTFVGLPTVFIRLTGCPLRCQYCDTAYAFKGGQKRSTADILAEVKKYQTPYVTLTGGEPLAQEGSAALIATLCDLKYQVSIETCGAFDIGPIDDRAIVVMDIKTPGSLEAHRNDWSNIEKLTHKDQVKMVICDRHDYDWCKKTINNYQLHEQTQVIFSPSYNQVSADTLAQWILDDQLTVRLGIQLHKVLWGEVPGR